MSSFQGLHFLLADDHALFREGLSLVLKKLDGIHLIEACNGSEVEARLSQTPTIDVLLLDYNMPGVGHSDTIQHICMLSPLTAVIVMSGDDSYHTIQDCLNAGANGFIPKSSSSQVMLNAIQIVLSGERYIPSKMVNGNKNKPPHADITKRQEEIWKLIIEGHSNKAIAFRLGVSENTVKQHVSALFRKLGVHSRTQAIRVAQEASA